MNRTQLATATALAGKLDEVVRLKDRLEKERFSDDLLVSVGLDWFGNGRIGSFHVSVADMLLSLEARETSLRRALADMGVYA